MKRTQYHRYGGLEELRMEEVALPNPGSVKSAYGSGLQQPTRLETTGLPKGKLVIVPTR